MSSTIDALLDALLIGNGSAIERKRPIDALLIGNGSAIERKRPIDALLTPLVLPKACSHRVLVDMTWSTVMQAAAPGEPGRS